jgi:anti-anti-sigma regulatory factor
MKIHEEQGYTVVTLDANVTKAAVPGMCEQFDGCLAGAHHDCILDMWELSTLNSSVANLIVYIVKKLAPSGCTLHVVNVGQRVVAALETIHLAGVVKVHETALDFQEKTGVGLDSIVH